MKRALAFLVIILAVATVFPQKKEEIMQRVIQLETENTQNKAAIDLLNTAIKNAQDANSFLEEKIKFQSDLNDYQNSTIKELEAKLAALQKQNDELKAEIAEMKRAAIDSDPRAIITEPTNEDDSIVSVLQQYFAAKRWEDRVEFVYKGEQMRPLMQEYHKDNFERRNLNRNRISIPGSNYKVGDVFFENYTDTYIRRTESGFKIDWEASVGYNKTPCGGYIAEEGSFKIQVRAILSNPETARWADFGVGENYYKIWFVTNDGADTYVYVSKTSSVGQQISKILKDGKKHRLILDVYGKKKYDDWENGLYFLFIDKIVQEGWVK